MGELDLVPRTLLELGVRQVFHGVGIKPGKPIWFGIHSTGTLVFGLPGNPVSAYVCFQIFVRAALERLLGNDMGMSFPATYRLDREFSYQTDRVTFWPGRTTDRFRRGVTLLPWKGSSDLRTLAEADVLVRLAIGAHTLPPETVVEAMEMEGAVGARG